MKTEIKKRLQTLRAEMLKLNIDAWYISGTDPHSSEYLSERWQTRAFISGFTGSYGMVVVTQSEAALWTDTRYFLQAADQLEGTGIEMMKLRVPDAVSPQQWLCNKLKSGAKVGMDASTVTADNFFDFSNILEKNKIELVETNDLLEKIWDNRPVNSKDNIFELAVKYTGLTRNEKQEQVVAQIKELGADYHVITMLDELAWQFNLRGSDISYNPVFNGFALIGANQSFLFVDDDKLDSELKNQLQIEGISIEAYSSFYSFLSELEGKRIFIDSSSANYAVYSALKGKNELVTGTSVVSLLKAKKNTIELAGFRKAMEKDGVALVEFHYWLKNNVGKKRLTEYEIGVKLKEFRAKQDGFKGESFPPIVGYREHGAIVHLTVGPDNALPIDADGILLFDSGGQYFEGTTDITRTVALGEITPQQKVDFTLVLKGMISLSRAKFPYGTKGCHLDILARQPLWEHGLNYGHGTGHGVGHFLNVHEGPMAIRQEFNENRIEPGHVMSNEPAFYREGEYGLRTENMITCIELEETEFGRFLGFETLTLCPIDTTLVDTSLLTQEEIDWLNDYHRKVRTSIKPILRAELHNYLDELTREI